jgi:prepilin-type N-terminal cleavage/methylation domain-containing protein
MIRSTQGRGEGGFTLIELLVVIIIIGILAAIAVPQYFKVVERGRVTEAHSFIGSIKGAQERYLARYGAYANNMAKLDIGLSGNCDTGGGQSCGMKFFQYLSCNISNTSNGVPVFNLTLTRCNVTQGCSADPPAAYGSYSVSYNRSSDQIIYGSCNGQSSPNSPCDNDF